MNTERWERVSEIVDGVLKRPDPKERVRFLRRACAGDKDLRQEVEGLLRHAQADDFRRRALAIRNRVYGERSTRTAAVLASLGRVLQRLGRHAEAEAVFVEALSIREERVGDAHPHVATSRQDLAVLRGDRND